MFMSLQPSPWPDTTKLCSGEVRPARSRLTGGSRERCVQRDYKRGFSINMTTVLVFLGLVGKPNRFLRVGGAKLRTNTGPKTSNMSRTQHNSGPQSRFHDQSIQQ
jgi:hypothetical protein